MKRPPGVILTVVVQVLGSLLTLSFSVLTIFMPAILRNTPGPTPPNPMEPQMFYGFAAMYGFFAVLGFLTAIGLFRLKNWARYSTLVFAGWLALMGLTVALVVALMPMPALPAEAGSVQQGALTPAMRAILAVFPLGLAALGALWLYYFNRAATKAVFAGEDAGSDVDAKGVLIAGKRIPMSICVIGVLNLISAVFLIPLAAWSRVNMFFGFIVTGFTAKATTLLVGAISGYVGISLLRLSNAGRRLAVAVNCLWLLNVVIMWFTPNRLREYLGLYQQNFAVGATGAAPTETATFIRWSMLISAVGIAVTLYFLVSRASAFRAGTVQVDSPAQ